MPRYEIRIAAPASEILAAAVPELRVIPLAVGTMLAGELRDGSDLQSVLARLADMGIEVDEYRKYA